MSANFVIEQTTWGKSKQALTSIRTAVFIEEQQVAVDLEWDEYDCSAIHLLAINNAQNPIGCARLVKNHIGRMAVCKPWRGQGIGRALLDYAIDHYRQQGCKQVRLSAQTHATSFYEQAGFKVISKPYLDANIWHVDMQLDI